jgi:ribosomal protein S18 acetylase RimI-like enzyme
MNLVLDPVRSDDAPLLARYMRDLYAHDDPPPDEARWLAALQQLLADRRLGWASVIRLDSQPVGYAVITIGYSLEFYGGEAFLDELYIAADQRGRGIGREVVRQIETVLRAQGVGALHLEVEEDNSAAQQLYEASGFRYRRHMHLMSKRLD